MGVMSGRPQLNTEVFFCADFNSNIEQRNNE